MIVQNIPNFVSDFLDKKEDKQIEIKKEKSEGFEELYQKEIRRLESDI